MKVDGMLIQSRNAIAILALSISYPLHVKAESTDQKIRQAFKALVAAENLYDESAVRALTWSSPSTLLMAKAPEGGRGYWGIDAVIGHLHDMYQQAFQMKPDYDSEQIVFLDNKVAEA